MIKTNEDQIKNCLAWYALEETAYRLEQEIQEELDNRENEGE